MSSELFKIDTNAYNGKLDKILDNGTEVYLKAKLTKRLTYGEYVGEPKNGFELILGDTVKILSLDNVEVFEQPVSPSLTNDQQIVFEWLKKSCTSYYYTSPMLAINKLYSSQQMAPPTVRLSKEEQYQVLAAFAEWGISMENAKEKMEAYLENLSKMGTKEVESLKEEYQNFSNDYQEEGRKE